ncbi:MAG: polyhydroxyalkanoate synthesis regulator DNA-binding domain-containing protein [Myxococcota bacterium]
MDARAEEAGGEPRLIKRYANRKLYDTRDSRYVTLQQIAEFVRLGEDVKIIDNKTKEDLTNVTLAQIIYEEEKKGEGESRKSSLKTFIQEGREKLVGSLPAPLSKLLREEEGKEEDKEKRASTLDGLKGLADDRIKAVISMAVGRVEHLQGEVKRLQGRIEDLETRLASLVKRGEDEEKDES